MSDLLAHLAGRVLLLNGAMGTQIQARAPTLADFDGRENCSEILNLTRPDMIREIHESYLAAGADALETNSFGGSPVTLGEFDLAAEAFAINRRAAELAREAIERFAGDGRRRFVSRWRRPSCTAPRRSSAPDCGILRGASNGRGCRASAR